MNMFIDEDNNIELNFMFLDIIETLVWYSNVCQIFLCLQNLCRIENIDLFTKEMTDWYWQDKASDL